MPPSFDLYGTAYGNFTTRALEQVRRDTYGDDFGQSSWVTADEYRRILKLLELRTTDRVLDVGCGSGGPARVEDVTDGEVEVSRRWHDARQKQKSELMRLEGEETFAGLQRFLATVHCLTHERRMSRFVYLGRKLGD